MDILWVDIMSNFRFIDKLFGGCRDIMSKG